MAEYRVPVPPDSMIFVGGGNFEAIGEKWLKFFIEDAGLAADAKVLDVGCGIGRMARPLTRYLSPAAEYRGFDIVREGVDWCREHIAAQFPNFQFHHADVYNRHYNPSGKIDARDYVFPFPDGYFDFVFLTSVFTHMLPDAVQHYLSEIARVMRPGAICAVSYFLLNGESLPLLRQGRSAIRFQHAASAECLAENPGDPEQALAYAEDYILAACARRGLAPRQPVWYGTWCGRPTPSPFYQDIVIARRI